MEFNLTSDLHIDSWIPIKSNLEKMQLKIDKFIESRLPEEIKNTLVIAGDLGNFNFQNVMTLKSLKRYFKNIVLIYGNHDYYLISPKQKKKYKRKSSNRIAEMSEFINQLENVYLLDGDTVTIEGVTYGGCTMWYDLQYGLTVQGFLYDNIIANWKLNFSDAKNITPSFSYNIQDMFHNEKLKLDNIIDKCDVIITHVSPDFNCLPNKYHDDIYSSYYLFNGEEYFKRIQDKIWCFGHIHSPMLYKNHGCYFANSSIGYPPDYKKSPNNNTIGTIII